MISATSLPYSPQLDKSIPDGTVVPGVVISGQYLGDRADVRCAGRWAGGQWALEVTRRLDMQSPYDLPIKTGTFMRVAAFDHTQIGTRGMFGPYSWRWNNDQKSARYNQRRNHFGSPWRLVTGRGAHERHRPAA